MSHLKVILDAAMLFVTLFSIGTQATRFFVNSSVNALKVGKLLSLNVSEVKGMAERAPAFCNTTGTRSFASVVAGKCDRGFLCQHLQRECR